MPLPDSEQLKTKFVTAVEEYPTLYNYNRKEYSNRNEQDKVWRLLAQQFETTGRFAQFDHGVIKNLQTYGSFTPPSYDLSAVSAPMTLFMGDNDLLGNSECVATLLEHLTCDVDIYRSPHEKFNHVDFLWAKDVKELVNDVIISILASKLDGNFASSC